ncbi:uncharacterized protein TNCV_4041101 [Trichonephila clavipes]|nr:uncharacterized protein TNCV_4041101 [Trichonephila clavipes]
MIHDGAPVHFCVSERNWLDMAYPGCWIRSGGSVLWPSRSPDLTPLDFFLYGQYQGIGVSRRSDCSNGLCCSSVRCLYFSEHCAVVKCTHLFQGKCFRIFIVNCESYSVEVEFRLRATADGPRAYEPQSRDEDDI